MNSEEIVSTQETTIITQESQEKPQEESPPVVKIDLAETVEAEVQPEAEEVPEEPQPAEAPLAEIKTEAENSKPMTVQVTRDTQLRRVISAAIARVKLGKPVTLKAFGRNQHRAVTLASIVRDRVGNLHQINSFVEEKNQKDGKERIFIGLQIILSPEELDTEDPGYQKPTAKGAYMTSAPRRTYDKKNKENVVKKSPRSKDQKNDKGGKRRPATAKVQPEGNSEAAPKSRRRRRSQPLKEKDADNKQQSSAKPNRTPHKISDQSEVKNDPKEKTDQKQVNRRRYRSKKDQENAKSVDKSQDKAQPKPQKSESHRKVTDTRYAVKMESTPVHAKDATNNDAPKPRTRRPRPNRPAEAPNANRDKDSAKRPHDTDQAKRPYRSTRPKPETLEEGRRQYNRPDPYGEDNRQRPNFPRKSYQGAPYERYYAPSQQQFPPNQYIRGSNYYDTPGIDDVSGYRGQRGGFRGRRGAPNGNSYQGSNYQQRHSGFKPLQQIGIQGGFPPKRTIPNGSGAFDE